MTSAFGDCDTGGDNATLLVAIGRHRVIGHTAAVVDSTPDDGAGPARSVSYTLVLHSVAHFIPTWTLDANALQGLPDTPSGSEPYVAWVGARVDTVTIIITQNIARPARWSVCDLNHARDAYTPFWNFANGQMRDISVVRWGPGTGSWAEVTRLADSVATSH